MKKFITALTLFEQKVPNTEVSGVERTLRNWFVVTTNSGLRYTVNIANNSVERSLDDPDWFGDRLI